MTTVVVVGAQWGDEGKGKIVDFLASQADMVVRCQGGSNAGHTVVQGGNVYKLHLIPSGILYPGVCCIIGNGVVVDLPVILEELDNLQAKGIDVNNLYISDRAQMIMPYHYLLDGLQEEAKADRKIGTTKRGIGPAYVDKVARSGLRMVDLFNWDSFVEKLRYSANEKTELLACYGQDPVNVEEIIEKFKEYRERIMPYIADTPPMVNAVIDAGKKVLFEGAQGTLLDIDHGTYPFVTSSSPTAGGACTGSGVGPTKIKRVIGITKAYTTRVGEGPFPSELLDEQGEYIRQKGYEFGTTTGRPRRCGWLDMMVVRYSVMVNGLTDLAITKLDVLDTLPELKICRAYRYNGSELLNFPADLDILAKCEPVYETMPGWMSDTSGCRKLEDLPEAARQYLARIEELAGAQISIVATGPDREQTMTVNELF